jgi:hypothetical protein
MITRGVKGRHQEAQILMAVKITGGGINFEKSNQVGPQTCGE